jgi:hypothetical protein
MFAYVSDGAPLRPFLITSPRAALWMSLQRTESGARFPNARVDGTGDVAGIRLLTSRAAGNQLVLVDAGRLAVVDEGLEVDRSPAGAVQLSDTPTAPTSLVSALQTSTVLIRFTRYLSWKCAGDDVVAFTTIDELAGSPA